MSYGESDSFRTSNPHAEALTKYTEGMATPRKPITAAEMDKMTPQARADAVEAGRAKTWDDVPEPFRSEVLSTAKELGEQRRRQRA